MTDIPVRFKTFKGETYYHWYKSPIGKLLITGNQSALATITFPISKPEPAQDWTENSLQFKEVCRQLDHYFAGTLKSFDLPLAPHGTAFQKSVWRQLLKIRYGQTTSYGSIAKQLGNEKAMRAVGSANGRNPISIIIPCHRVIGSDGNLTGYGGGLPTKSFLLNLENNAQQSLSL